MKHFKDISNQRFDRLVALFPEEHAKDHRAMWHCRCDCGSGEKQIRTQSGFRNLFAQYRSRAKTYKLPFTLDDASFLLFTSSNCYYCGTPPTRTRTSSQDHSPYAWNGIDRIDSGRGYELWNCVPSCLPCNMAKSAMTPSEFQDWLDRISEYHSNQFRSINAAAEILSQCA